MKKLDVLSLAPTLMTAFLMGCSSNPPLSVAITELGTATRTDKGSAGLRLMRVVNVTGLNSSDVVGSFSVDPDPPLFELPPLLGSSDVPDTLTPRLTPGCSLIEETKFSDAESGKNISQADVLSIREKLIAVDDATLAVVRANLKKDAIEVITAAYKKERAKTAADATLLAQLTEQAKRLDAALTDLDANSDATSTLNKAATNAAKAADDAKQALDGIQKELERLLSKSRIVVTHWTRKTQAGADASVANAIEGGFQKQSEVSGYRIAFIRR